jgi:hypothetical protein
MFKSLIGLFPTGPALPYHIDEELDEAWGQPLWKHYRGRSKVRGRAHPMPQLYPMRRHRAHLR